MPAFRAALRPALPAVLGVLLASCSTPLLDAPSEVRQNRVVLPPVYWDAESADGSSWCWWGAFGLVGAEAESQRSGAWALPLWWTTSDPPYSESTALLPFYYGSTTLNETSRFYSLLYGYKESDTWRNDYALIPIFSRRASKLEDTVHTTVFPLCDWQTERGVDELTLVPLLGLAHVYKAGWGYPADDGDRSDDRMGDHSGGRRLELVNLLGIVSLLGYDDVGETRELRALTLFSNETWSPLYSRRGLAPDDPFVREWLFPLYTNVADDDGGWAYVGPFWGWIDDTAERSHTDWWLLGLLSRNQAPAGDTWRVLGIPVSEP